MDTETIDTISWQEFQSRKEKARKDILTYTANRLEGIGGRNQSIDLDLVPFLNAWDDITFSFPITSCSGTPKEHSYRKGYGRVNGHMDNPHAIFMAHSYMAHPYFEMFKSHLEEYLEGKADNKSQVHSLDGYEGIYLHIVSVRLPKEILKGNDMEFLERFWKDFKENIEDFTNHNHYRSDWINYNP